MIPVNIYSELLAEFNYITFQSVLRVPYFVSVQLQLMQQSVKLKI